MCGIVAIRREGKSKKVSKMIIKRYHNQRSRGNEGFGFVSVENGHVKAYTRSQTEEDIITELKKSDTHDIMFHHRYPTSTPNFAPASHPIKVSHKSLKYDYFMVHNGVIWNDKALKAEHEKLGFKYNTEIEKVYQCQGKVLSIEKCFNDSEALAIALAISIDQEGKGIDAIGSIAFVMYQVKKNSTKVVRQFYGRNYGSPLLVEHAKDFTAITSAGSGTVVPTNILFWHDYETGRDDMREFIVGSEREYVYQNNVATGNYNRVDVPYDFSEYVDGVAKIEPRPSGDYETMEQMQMEFNWLKAEYDELQKKLSKINDPYSKEAIELQDQLMDIEDELFPYSNLGYNG